MAGAGGGELPGRSVADADRGSGRLERAPADERGAGGAGGAAARVRAGDGRGGYEGGGGSRVARRGGGDGRAGTGRRELPPPVPRRIRRHAAGEGHRRAGDGGG